MLKKIVCGFLLFFSTFLFAEKDVYVLLSNNGGKGTDFGLKYEYPYEKPTNPADRFKDQPDTFGNRLLNGQPWYNWWDCIGINYKDLTVDFKWTEQHKIGLLKILMTKPQKPKIIEIYTRIQSDGEWRET